MYESPVFKAYVRTHCYMCESGIQNTLSHLPLKFKHIVVVDSRFSIFAKIKNFSLYNDSVSRPSELTTESVLNG